MHTMYTLVLLKTLRKPQKFILTKINKKSRISKNFRCILIRFSAKIESRVRKCKCHFFINMCMCTPYVR